MVLHVSVCFLILYEIVKAILQFVSIIFYIFFRTNFKTVDRFTMTKV